jgi:hypothetical protein
MSRMLVIVANTFSHLRHMLSNYYILRGYKSMARNNEGELASTLSRIVVFIHVILHY